MRPIFIVPNHERIEFSSNSRSAQWKQYPASALVLHGPDEALDHGGASVLPIGAVARTDYETTVRVLTEVTTDLIAELPGAFPFFQAFYRHNCGHALKGRYVVKLPQKKWKSFPGAESKPAGGRPVYRRCQEWLTQRRPSTQAAVITRIGLLPTRTATSRRSPEKYRLGRPWRAVGPRGHSGSLRTGRLRYPRRRRRHHGDKRWSRVFRLHPTPQPRRAAGLRVRRERRRYAVATAAVAP